MTVKINASTSDGLKIVSDTSGAIDFQKSGTTQVSIDTNGNIGAGTSSPTHLAAAYTTIEAKGTDTNGSGVILATSTAGIQTQMISSDASGVGTIGTRTNHPCTFSINNAEKMRINSSGQILMGSTSQDLGERLHVAHTGGGAVCVMRTVNSGGTVQIGFKNANGFVGEIVTSGSGTSYATSSDYRLKENVSYTFDATSRLKQLKPARFNFKADADTTLDGFLAHEVSSIVPEAVVGTKDETETYKDDNGDDQTRNKYQGIDQAKLVPLLVKTIQELEARITALES